MCKRMSNHRCDVNNNIEDVRNGGGFSLDRSSPITQGAKLVLSVSAPMHVCQLLKRLGLEGNVGSGANTHLCLRYHLKRLWMRMWREGVL
jgi:hypothetical protein